MATNFKAQFPKLVAAAGIAIFAGCTSAGHHRTVGGHVHSHAATVPPAVAKLSESARDSAADEGSEKQETVDATPASTSDPTASTSPATNDIELASAEGVVEDAPDNRSVDFNPHENGTDGPSPLPLSQGERGVETAAGVDSNPRYEDPPNPADAPERANHVPIDFATALQLTAGQNPQVGFAQQRIQEAFAQLQSAEVLWVPSIRAGVNYNKHEGRIQDVVGQVIETSRGSVYTGFGAQAVGAGSPAVPGLVMNFHLRDAVFLPRIAERALGARQQAGQAVTNDTLLETALAYTDLLEALQTKAVADESLANAVRLAELTKSFAETGQGLRADADRAQAELSVRQIEIRRAAENARVASVRLTRLLSQDQTQVLSPLEPALVPIELVAVETPLAELVATGLSYRPELAEAQFLVGEAVQRLRRERYAPLVPSVLLGLSYGGNGGGLGGDIDNFGDRLDFDAAAFWEVRNFGFGEQAARHDARARLEQARWRQVQMLDQVAADVSEAQAQVAARKEQIALAQAGIEAARDSYRRNTERISAGQGLPIETLQSIQALDQAQRQYVRAVADYNRAQFRLHRALGWPVHSPHVP